MSSNLDHLVNVLPVGDNDVTLPEFNLILLILLEKTWRNNYVEEEDEEETTRTDNTEDSVGRRKRNRIETDGGNRSSGLRRAQQYVRELLHYINPDIPYKDLNEREMSLLVERFTPSSELIPKKPYKSIHELHEALRQHSKFREQFQVLQTIGRGKYGRVMVVKSKDSPEDLSAIKQIIPKMQKLTHVKMILMESESLKKLRGHPNIVEFHDSWLAMESAQDGDQDDTFANDPLVFYLKMEVCGETLKDWKQRLVNQKMKPADFEYTCVKILTQILEGLRYIHDNGILHLDLNPSNIFWKDNSHRMLKIGDFGYAIHVAEVKGRRGTSPYCAPEDTMTSKSDIYSVGVTIFELAELTKTMQELCSRVERLDFLTGIKIVNDVMPKMLSKAPGGRLNASQVLAKLEELEGHSNQ